MIFNEEQQKLEETKNDLQREMVFELTQIDSVKRDMQFSVRRQLRQMGILERKEKSYLRLIKGNDSFMQIDL